MSKIIPFGKIKQNSSKELTPSDKQTIDAIELLIEYMAEVGCDIDSIVDSKELGDVIHRLHILISKANGDDPTMIDLEKGIDISFLYNDNGYLKDPDS